MSRYLDLLRGSSPPPRGATEPRPPGRAALAPIGRPDRAASDAGIRVERRRREGVLGAVYRHKRLFGVSLFAFLAIACLAAWLQPIRYEARVKLLVRRDRVDTVMSATRENPPIRTDISQEEIQSETQIVTSRDLLQQVITTCNVPPSPSVFAATFAPASAEARGSGNRLDRRVIDLERQLVVSPIKKSNIFVVSYAHRDRAVAACVLNTLSKGYVEKHLALQRPQGALAFFQREVERNRTELAGAEAELSRFTRDAGAPAVELERELKVRKLQETEGQLRDTRAALAEAAERRRTLEATLTSAPTRQTTQVRIADNAQLLERLQGTLLTLELKRTELLTRYEPEYRLVTEVDAQITQARDALRAAESRPVRDETSDNDPTHQWLRSELTKARTELAALAAREAAQLRLVGAYRDEARELAQKAVRQQELVREVKTREETYLLYLRKEEEARVSDALDRQRIANVVIAEPANVAETPTSLRRPVLMAGAALSFAASLLLVLLVDQRKAP